MNTTQPDTFLTPLFGTVQLDFMTRLSMEDCIHNLEIQAGSSNHINEHIDVDITPEGVGAIDFTVTMQGRRFASVQVQGHLERRGTDTIRCTAQIQARTKDYLLYVGVIAVILVVLNRPWNSPWSNLIVTASILGLMFFYILTTRNHIRELARDVKRWLQATTSSNQS